MADLSTSTDIPVYVGFWTNWSHGRIAGATLTLTHRDGAFLTASLALFVTFVGTNFWRIISFTLHQFNSPDAPIAKDGLYHQTQLTLRNSTSGITGLTRLLSILWVWRRKAKSPLYRLLPLITATALSAAAFAVAGIFSAKISSGPNNEVLVSGTSCGQLYDGDPTDEDWDREITIFQPYLSKQAYSYANYVQTCYVNTSKAEGCGLFIKRQFLNSIDRNASCPFQETICRHKDRNVRVDTGPLAIDSDLGFNVPPSRRYTFRFVTSCAPLNTDKYKEKFDYSEDVSYMRYFYGQHKHSNATKNPYNYTYEAQIPSIAQILSQKNGGGYSDYRLG